MSDYLKDNNFEKAIDLPLLRLGTGFHTRSRELQDVVDAIKDYVKKPTAANITQVSKRLQHWKITNPKEFQHRIQHSGHSIEPDLRQELEDAYAHFHLTLQRSVWGLEGKVRVLEGTVTQDFQNLMAALTGDGQASLLGGFQAANRAIGRMVGGSETARRVFDAVDQNSRGEIVVIVPIVISGGGFVHKEKVRAEQQGLHQDPNCGVNYIVWQTTTPYVPPGPDVQPAYRLARLHGAPVKNKFLSNPPVKESIHLAVGAQIVESYPPEIVLLHEIGHAFQYIYGRDMYLNTYTNDLVQLDAMNITYVERPMLKELGTREFTLYRLRFKYGSVPFKSAVLQGAPNWGYSKIHSPAELVRLQQTLANDAIYDPSDPNAKAELTAAADHH